MNKRIQELARQAYIEDAKSEDPNYQPADVTDDLLEDLSGVFERFAQLIAQDILNQLTSPEMAMLSSDGSLYKSIAERFRIK